MIFTRTDALRQARGRRPVAMLMSLGTAAMTRRTLTQRLNQRVVNAPNQ